MPDEKLHLDITNDSVSVRLNGDSGRKRFYALAFFSALTALGVCLLLFLPGKNGSSSIWHDRSASFVLTLTFPSSFLF
jgi:hypothetical protein